MKFVVNTRYGGFGLSDKAIDRLIELGLEPGVERIDEESDSNYRYRAYTSQMCENRFHPLLVQVVEELGKEANSDASELHVAKVQTEYLADMLIEEHDGQESVRWPAIIIYEDDDE